MIEAIYAIITDADARDAAAVEASLVDGTSAGAPWANEE